jgi:predicted NBD/HSP70 family sugar kinase
VIGAGMGLPGPIESGEGVVGTSAILPGWIGMTAEAEMRRRLEIPVMVDNDANLGALAEAAFGAGRAAGDLVYLKVSSGIGAGLILNGRLYRGAGGLAGELGHVLVDPNGVVCRCGNRGCLETVAGTGALIDRLRPTHGDDLTVEAMLEGARTGDAACRRVIHDAGRAVGQVVATLMNVLNPELFVVGGHLGRAGDELFAGIRESVARAALPETARRAEVVAGVLGDRAHVLGALALVVSEADRILVPA